MCRDLILKYFHELLGGPQVFDALLGPLISSPPLSAASSAAEAGRWIRRERSYQLSPEQYRALAADEATYWCFEFLFSDRGAWSAQALSRALGLAPARVEPALARLKKLGLVEERTRGSFRNPRAGAIYFAPAMQEGMRECMARISRYWDAMHKRRGDTLMHQMNLLRAEEGSMRGLMPELLATVDAASCRSVFEKGHKTGFYLVETRVRRLFQD